MAFARFTGKSGGTTITYNAVTIPGWRKITIDEKGLSLPEAVDVTAAQDAVYTFVDDPLGGKTAPSCTVTIEGFLSVTDKADGAAGLLQFAPGDTYDLIVTTKSLGDMFTLEDATLKTWNSDVAVAGVVPYTVTFNHSTSSGVWSTDT